MRTGEHLIELLGCAELRHRQRGQRIVDFSHPGRLTCGGGLAARQVELVMVRG